MRDPFLDPLSVPRTDTISSREHSLSFYQRIRATVEALSPFEKLVFGGLLLLLAVISAFQLIRINNTFLTVVPTEGGSLVEGIMGSPRFINPLLAISDADRDLSALVYSGLLKPSSDGTLIPDLADGYTISPDGLTYTFTIREDAVFHDGTPVTAEDVRFTIGKAQDPAIKSPRRASWEGVQVTVEDAQTVVFTLSAPYAPFLENMTLGILPKHIWGHADASEFPFSQFNTEPIGSGPYSINSIKRDTSGIITSYELKAFSDYTLGEPFIKTLTTRFYPNEETLVEAYRSREVEGISGISPQRAAALGAENTTVLRTPLPRIFGVFFNQNKAPVFSDIAVRRALDLALPKQAIVDSVLAGYGSPLEGPLPIGVAAASSSAQSAQEERTRMARTYLEEDGWEQNAETGIWEKDDAPLAFSISTADTPELKEAAEAIAQEWRAFGADVTVKIFEIGDLNQNVIRPRDYESLFFGEIVGRDLDLFAFWHSSQRNDPGLNIALYTNITTDQLLTDARKTLERDARLEKYHAFETELIEDAPAVFVYSPDFLYFIPTRIAGIELGTITAPEERFLNVHQWYVETDRVWTLFK